jgi:hypothetical protein
MQGIQQANQQSQMRYQQAMLENQAQNLASQRAMTGAWIKAGGDVASSSLTALGQAGKGWTFDGGTKPPADMSAAGYQH